MPIHAWILLIISITIAFGVIVYTILKTLHVVCNKESRKHLDPEEKKGENNGQ
jgi:hypothetical protein